MLDQASQSTCYQGLAASEGLTFAPVVRFEALTNQRPAPYAIAQVALHAEVARLYTALNRARQEIDELMTKTKSATTQTEAGIFDAHIMMIEDDFFIDTIIKRFRKEKINIATLVYDAFQQIIDTMADATDAYMRERVADLYDVRHRLISLLQGDHCQRHIPKITRPSIVIADNITPSDAVALPLDYIRGMATEHGSLTAHVTVLARALGIPAIVGIGQSLDAIQTGDEVALNGFDGELWHLPSAACKVCLLAATQEKRTAIDVRKRLVNQPAITPDGVRIHLSANTDHSIGFAHIGDHGAEGIGLYRSEYLWITAGKEPTEDEQYQAYSEVLRSANGKPVTIRVLDIGGDKLVSSTSPQAAEANPFLGNRSIRYLLTNKATFRSQIRAILRAAIAGDCRMMYPMISTVQELLDCNAFVAQCKEELRHDGIPFKDLVPIGLMIEVPAAVVLAPVLAKHVDFFSIGSNDLVQYTFAADRGNESISYLYQPFSPVILHLVYLIVTAAKRYGKPVCVCGEMASNPVGALLLIGLGIRELSMSANLIPRIKELICRISYYDMQRLIDTIKRQALNSPERVITLATELITHYAPDVIK